MRSQRPFRLVVGAFAGGHVNELLTLLQAAKGLWPVEPCAFVTTMTIAVRTFDAGDRRVMVLGEGDRTKPLQSIAVFFRAAWAAIALRPSVVVTTGSMPLAMFCLWSRLLGSRIVWIDSVAQVDEMSLSGRIVKPFADLCLVQWEHLTKRYEGTRYAGELF